MSLSYYIYYRVDPSQARAARQRVKQLLALVKSSAHVNGRLLKKRGEPNLWMEVYENVAETAEFEQALADAVSKLKAIEFLQSGTGRHIESFED